MAAARQGDCRCCADLLTVIAQVSALCSLPAKRNAFGFKRDFPGCRPVSEVKFSQVSGIHLNGKLEVPVPWFRRARGPAAPERPAPTMLEVYQAQVLPDLSGWWVYALGASTDGHIWYVGMSESLMRRVDAHAHAHPELWDPRRVYVIPCIGEPEASIRQLALIDYYQPERNTLATTQMLRKRVASLDKPAGRLSRSLDRSQANA
jgi:hypothetical protein